MTPSTTIHTQLILDEIGRELAVRRTFFAKQIDEGKMTRDQANHYFACLESAQKILGGHAIEATKPIREALLEVKRELGMRQRVYPNLIARQIMSQGESVRKINLFVQAAEILESMMPPEKPEYPNQLNLFG
jgi:hypothetical protein